MNVGSLLHGTHATGAAIQRSVSPQYRDLQAMLLVRVSFDPRRGVVSADLPVLGL